MEQAGGQAFTGKQRVRIVSVPLCQMVISQLSILDATKITLCFWCILI
jgi:hypothetical protein